MSWMSNFGNKTKGSNTYCTLRHITASLWKWALVVKQEFASPPDLGPSYQTCRGESTRDTPFEQALMLLTQDLPAYL
jgi:hypothetical protein